MPWKVTQKMELRKKFVLRIAQGEKMTDLCREFGISRKTGYKIYNRFLETGQKGLEDQRKRPLRLANLLDEGMSSLILKFKQEKPTWGAPKLRELLIRRQPSIKPPAVSTIHALLDRNGLVKNKRKKNSFKSSGTYLSVPVSPNDLWCTDFKGQFRLRDQSYCYPLTITDQVSRQLLAIDAMERIDEFEVIKAFTSVFREYGLPLGIRSDNGVPFATRSVFGLSKLSIWWLRLGIKIERIEPGKPQQNGRHERMHRTLKLSATKPPSANILSQQERFDQFLEEYNLERPHEALQMKTPSDVYKKSSRPFPEVIEELEYPEHDKVCRVNHCGTIALPERKRVWIGMPFSGQKLGLKQIDDQLWQVTFMEHDLGFFDELTYKFTPGENPFES